MKGYARVCLVFLCVVVSVCTFRVGICTNSARLSIVNTGRAAKPQTAQFLKSSPLFAQQSEISHDHSWFSNIKAIWDFTRPHTIIGSCISILSLYLSAVPQAVWTTPLFLKSLVSATVPSLFMNLYITGLNQVTDVEIDKINKPYLPLASGSMSQTTGVRVVLASLALALMNVKTMAWPLQYTLVGSALLGTVYSLPPFRLKRFPLLAAMCILVVRGSLINMGFYLQAKATVLGQTLPRPTSLAPAALGAFAAQAWRAFPEAVAVTAFFAVFGVVIALMKDVPDVRGDLQHRIPSFSVQLGATKMFSIAWRLLQGLLLTASAGVLVYSTALQPAWRSVAWLVARSPLPRYVPAAVAALPHFVTSALSAPWLTAAAGGVTGLAVSPVTRNVRVGLAAVLALMARDVRHRALRVEAENPDKVFAYYMHVWNIFYACYLMLPALSV